MTAVELAQLWQAWARHDDVCRRCSGSRARCPTGREMLSEASLANAAVLEEYRQDVAAALDIQAKASAGHAEKSGS